MLPYINGNDIPKNNLFVRISAWFFGIFFMASGVLKLLFPINGPTLLSQFIAQYIDTSIDVAMVVSIAEIAVGVALFIPTVRVAAFTMTSLFFFAAIFASFTTNSVGLECGCFGDISSSKVDSTFIARNSILFLVSVFSLNIILQKKESSSEN